MTELRKKNIFCKFDLIFFSYAQMQGCVIFLSQTTKNLRTEFAIHFAVHF